jgi:AcrR family transcriptional regulator
MLTATTESPPVARRREQSSLTRRHILEASMHLFSRNGYPGTTVREIAREAGISDAAIYYHFRTKDDVLHALLDSELEPLRHSRDVARSLDETLWSMAEHAVRVIDANLDLLRIIVREALAGDEAAAGRYRALLDGWESGVSARLRPFEQRGEIAAGTAAELSQQLVWTVAMAVQDYLLLGRPNCRSHKERRRELLAFLAAAVSRLAAAAERARAGLVAPATGGR